MQGSVRVGTSLGRAHGRARVEPSPGGLNRSISTVLRAPKIPPERNPGGGPGPMLVVGCGACTLRGPSWASESPGPHLRCRRVLSERRFRGGPLATRGPGPARATVPPLSLRLCTCGRSWQWRRQCSAVQDGPLARGNLNIGPPVLSSAPRRCRHTRAGRRALAHASCQGPASASRGSWPDGGASRSLSAQSRSCRRLRLLRSSAE